MDVRLPLGQRVRHQERVCSVAERKQPHAALEYVREGDILMVSKLDRLARSVFHLMMILEALDGKQVASSISAWTPRRPPANSADRSRSGRAVRKGHDARTTTGGIANAKSEGRYKGRKPIEAERRANVLRFAAAGATRADIAAQLGLGAATAYRILAVHKAPTL